MLTVFTLNPEIGEFVLTHSNMTIPEDTQEFAINASNQRFWEPPVKRYIDECLDGTEGPRGKNFNMRWVAAMVADVHRIITRGRYLHVPDRRKKFARRVDVFVCFTKRTPCHLLLNKLAAWHQPVVSVFLMFSQQAFINGSP